VAPPERLAYLVAFDRSALAHEGHDVAGLQRRYLLLPGLRSSNLHVNDTGRIRPAPPWSRGSMPRS
jgi:hypothetical protein